MAEVAQPPPEAPEPYGPLLTTTLRVVTWNVWWRFGPWERRQEAIEATLAALNPDIVCLQEVWGGPGGDHQAARLAEVLGLHPVHAHRRADDGVSFGNAVLSRWPVVRVEQRDLPAGGAADEHRLVLLAEVDGPRGPVQVFCTHLNWRLDHSAVRQQQLRAIAAFIAKCRPRRFPPVLCGDLNAAPDSDEIRMLTGRSAPAHDGLVFQDAWEVAGGPTPGSTHDPLTNGWAAAGLLPSRRIDYVLVGWPKRGGAGHPVGCRLAGVDPVGGVLPSDHYAVVADLRY